MSIDTHSHTFDHAPTYADIQSKLAELRETGAPKPGVVALAPADYRELAREVFGDPLPGFYAIYAYGTDRNDAVPVVAMPSVEPHSVVFVCLAVPSLLDMVEAEQSRKHLERIGFFDHLKECFDYQPHIEFPTS